METPNFIESYQTENYKLCDDLINKLEYVIEKQVGNLMIGQIDNGGAVNRVDCSVNLKTIGDELCFPVNELLNQYVREYIEKYQSYGTAKSISEDVKVQKTSPKGGFHKWHFEQSPKQNDAYRVLTWTLYLNDIPDGEGETEFLEYGIKVQPKKGLLCFFPAAWTHIHRGNPVYSCDKYIATGWYYLTN